MGNVRSGGGGGGGYNTHGMGNELWKSCKQITVYGLLMENIYLSRPNILFTGWMIQFY